MIPAVPGLLRQRYGCFDTARLCRSKDWTSTWWTRADQSGLGESRGSCRNMPPSFRLGLPASERGAPGSSDAFEQASVALAWSAPQPSRQKDHLQGHQGRRGFGGDGVRTLRISTEASARACCPEWGCVDIAADREAPCLWETLPNLPEVMCYGGQMPRRAYTCCTMISTIGL